LKEVAVEKVWNVRVTDPKERKVFEALSDPQWDFRTVDGIAKAINLKPEEVKAVIDKYPDLVRKSLVRGSDNKDLFTLASRPPRAQELLSQFTNFITKSSH
jgi:hypothetical protein